jgi:hypothetical protein
MRFGPQLSYKDYTKPVYRGFDPFSDFFDRDLYKRHSIGTWTTFQSCTLDKEVALGFSLEPQEEAGTFDQHKELLIFEIYLNGQNSPFSQI